MSITSEGINLIIRIVSNPYYGIIIRKLEIPTGVVMEKPFYKTRLRNKGQITIPPEVRNKLGAEEGDDLLFSIDDRGRIIVSRAQIIPPDQAWFWSEHWQRLERAAQADLEEGNVVEFGDVSQALAALDQIEAADDAED
jgi:AbrB family looped-hinge helix DNA binding protein